MNPRERLLGALVLVVLVGWGLRSVHNRLDTAYRFYVNQEIGLQDTLTTEELKVAAGLQAAGQMADWRDRSLPTDPTQANLLYQDWLLERLDEAGLAPVDAPKMGFRTHTEGSILEYTISADGGLDEAIDFLYAFYRANHLHKLAKIDFAPDETGRNLELTMRIEAWALNDSFNTEKLAAGESDRLAYDSREEYYDRIVDHNIFVVYEPPEEEQVVDALPLDHAEHAYATGLVESNGKPQVWINVRSTGDQYRLSEGESFDVGEMECRIIKIGTRSIVFEAAGKQYFVKLGSSLREATPVEGDQA